MEAKAKLRHLRIAPRKTRLVVDMVRGKTAKEAQVILRFTSKRAALPLLKLLNSAVANAKVLEMNENNLYISEITVDEGPKLKRWRARSRGRAFGIQKKTSHINLTLSEIKGTTKKKTKKEDKKTETKIETEKKFSGETKKGFNPKLKREKSIKKTGRGQQTKKVFRRKAF